MTAEEIEKQFTPDDKIPFSKKSLDLVKWIEEENKKFLMFYYSEIDKDFLAYKNNLTKEEIKFIINELRKL
jgi:hypothetical protein